MLNDNNDVIRSHVISVIINYPGVTLGNMSICLSTEQLFYLGLRKTITTILLAQCQHNLITVQIKNISQGDCGKHQVTNVDNS